MNRELAKGKFTVLDYVKLTSKEAIDEFFYEQEFGFLKAFAEDEDLFLSTQFRCLWTSFCIHNDIEVDTDLYDSLIKELWDIAEDKFAWISFGSFENFMCKYLV